MLLCYGIVHCSNRVMASLKGVRSREVAKSSLAVARVRGLKVADKRTNCVEECGLREVGALRATSLVVARVEGQVFSEKSKKIETY